MRITIFTDGGARGNPGPAASAFVVYNLAEKEIHHQYSRLGVATNNIAEYSAVLMALKWLLQNYKNFEKPFDFYLDSLLVVKQLNKEFKIKNQNLKQIFIEIFSLVEKIGDINFNYIPREKNIRADELVNICLDS
ncbi:MAG: Ribonuclease H [Candidatus Woesebacteria bacterium GW2011_GWB1_38_5b]|uniref:Ribonuclease H n=1 Tax=Candidatus Woesebacteria bacterium GW2011_GWB1_38_5b TaxID=1618569 RepID=A0A0G0KHC3_9BACT|nr:MAG: Ribonuclease H [Candidatus Woesebacteria bacterium GW2011_GWB1_38_5b]